MRYSHSVQARHVGHRCPAADIDEDAVGAEDFGADLDLLGRHEARVAAIDAGVLEGRERSFDATVGETDDVVFSCLDALHVDLDVSRGAEAELGAAPRQMHGVGAGDQRLGGRAAGIDAGAAEATALDDRDFHARAGQPAGERRACLPGPDDDRVVVRHPVSPSCVVVGRGKHIPRPRTIRRVFSWPR